MIKKFEDIISEFGKLGYNYHYHSNSHSFRLLKLIDGAGYVMNNLYIDYRKKHIVLDGGFGKEELNLIKKLIEKLEEK